MGYLISILLIILCFKFKTSKKLFVVMFLWMWILFAFSSGNADYNMYKELYVSYGQSSLNFDINFFFMLLCKIFYSLGFSYNMFLGLYSMIGLILIGSTIYRFSEHRNMVAALYFIFPFVLDVVQIKNFMAMAIVIYAMRFLMEDKKGNYLKYLALNLVAIGFHLYAVICLVFVLIKKLKLKTLNIMIAIITILGIVLCTTGLIIPLVSLVLPEDKVTAYFIWELYTPGMSSVLKCILIIGIAILFSHICEKIIQEKNRNEIDEKQSRLLEFIIKVNHVFVCFIPMLFYINQIMRLPREMMVYIYILVGNAFIGNTKKLVKYNLILYIGVGILIFIWMQTFIFSINVMDTTITPLFEQNYLMKFLHI